MDAVEIDPVLVKLSRRFNASGIYDDPRVRVHVDDARAFLQRSPGGYDMIIFGWLDSQALFSSMSNLRLDGFIYTVQSMRAAYRCSTTMGLFRCRLWLAGNGCLASSFVCFETQRARHHWSIGIQTGRWSCACQRVR